LTTNQTIASEVAASTRHAPSIKSAIRPITTTIDNDPKVLLSAASARIVRLRGSVAILIFHRASEAVMGHASAIGIARNASFLLTEAAFGMVANSVGLLADAGHNLVEPAQGFGRDVHGGGPLTSILLMCAPLWNSSLVWPVSTICTFGQ
jgi:hypothetical protein